MTKIKRNKALSLAEVTDKYIGKKGTPERNEFDNEVKLEVIGDLIKHYRKQQNLNQTQLGELIGVKKSQISKLENNTKDIRMSTFMKVMLALGVKLDLNATFKGETILINFIG